MTTSEKVAYLKGLAEGYGMDKESREGKILSTIIDVLEDLALSVEDIDAELDELNEGLDCVSDDLADVEDLLFDEEDEDEDDEDCGCGCEEEPMLYEAVCPNCGDSVTFDEDILEQGGIQCPGCGESLEFDLGGEDEEEDDGFLS